MQTENGVKTKFIRWTMAVMVLWALSELGATPLKPHIPWLVGLTFVWAVMLPLLDNPAVLRNQIFIRLMLAYVTSGLSVAIIAPFFLDMGDDWRASLIFHGALINVSGLAFLVYRYGREWSDAGPAVGALMLAGLAMYLVRTYTLGYALLVELSIAFLLTVSATFCLFLLVSIANCYTDERQEEGRADPKSEPEIDELTPVDGLTPLVPLSGKTLPNDDPLLGRAGAVTPPQMVKHIGSLLALLLLAAILITMVNNVF